MKSQIKLEPFQCILLLVISMCNNCLIKWWTEKKVCVRHVGFILREHVQCMCLTCRAHFEVTCAVYVSDMWCSLSGCLVGTLEAGPPHHLTGSLPGACSGCCNWCGLSRHSAISTGKNQQATYEGREILNMSLSQFTTDRKSTLYK